MACRHFGEVLLEGRFDRDAVSSGMSCERIRPLRTSIISRGRRDRLRVAEQLSEHRQQVRIGIVSHFAGCRGAQLFDDPGDVQPALGGLRSHFRAELLLGQALGTPIHQQRAGIRERGGVLLGVLAGAPAPLGDQGFADLVDRGGGNILAGESQLAQPEGPHAGVGAGRRGAGRLRPGICRRKPPAGVTLLQYKYLASVPAAAGKSFGSSSSPRCTR